MDLPLLALAALAALSAPAGAKAPDRRVWLWCEANANWKRLNSLEGVKEVLDKSAAAGVTDVIVDVKPISGETLYPSKVAPRFLEWEGVRLEDPGFDRLAVVIKEGHQRGLRVHASLNVFSEAHKQISPVRGVLLSRPDWQTILYTKDGFKPTLDVDQGPGGYAGFVNPIIPEVEEHELAVIKEIAGYPVDGIVFDRLRYDNFYADFSDLSRREFEKADGPVARWPQDIFELGTGFVKPGPRFKAWVAWRAANIKSFLEKARAAAKGVSPKIEVNAYVGSWLPLYYDVGVNWASDAFHPGYSWASPAYEKAGYAKLLDRLMTGCYYRDATVAEVRAKKERVLDRLTGKLVAKGDYYSVEGGCDVSNAAAAKAAPVYASLFISDFFDDQRKEPEKFAKALALCLKKTRGVMLFDLVYIEKYDLWSRLRSAFKR